MLNPEDSGVLVSALSFIINSPNFQKLLEKLDTKEQRQEMVQFAHDNYVYKVRFQETVRNKSDPDILATLTTLVEYVNGIPKIEPEERAKMALGYAEAEQELEHRKQMVKDTLTTMLATNDSTERRRLGKDAIRKVAALDEAIITRVREICRDIYGLHINHKEFIDQKLDELSLGHMSFIRAESAKYKEFIRDRIADSRIPKRYFYEAILVSGEVAVEADPENASLMTQCPIS